MAETMSNSWLIPHELMNFQHGHSSNNEMKQKCLIGSLMSINDIFSSTDMNVHHVTLFYACIAGYGYYHTGVLPFNTSACALERGAA